MPRLRGGARGPLFLTPPASWRAVPAQESQLCFRTQVLPAASEPSHVAFTVPGSGAVCLVHWLLSAQGDTLRLLSPEKWRVLEWHPQGHARGSQDAGFMPWGLLAGYSAPHATAQSNPLRASPTTQAPSTAQGGSLPPKHSGTTPPQVLLHHQAVLHGLEKHLGAVTLPTVGLSASPAPRRVPAS